jgi:hypothetical protein
LLILAAALSLANCAPQHGIAPAQRSPVSGGPEFYRSLRVADRHPRPATGGDPMNRPAADLMPPVVVSATRYPDDGLDGWPSCRAVAELNVARVLSLPLPPPSHRPPQGQLDAWQRSLR